MTPGETIIAKLEDLCVSNQTFGLLDLAVDRLTILKVIDDEIQNVLRPVEDSRDRLIDEVEELRRHKADGVEDSARLDWLELNGAQSWKARESGKWTVWVKIEGVLIQPTETSLREAIDAARNSSEASILNP